MILIEINILQNNVTLDIDEVTDCILILSRINIYCQIWYLNVSHKSKI